MSKPATTIKGSVVPKNAKELSDWMMQDNHLRQRVTDIVVKADQMIGDEVTKAFTQFLRERDIDLRMMSHDQASEALNRFYRASRLAGQFVRMW